MQLHPPVPGGHDGGGDGPESVWRGDCPWRSLEAVLAEVIAGHPAGLGEKLPNFAAGQPASSIAVPMEVETAEGPGGFLV